MKLLAASSCGVLPFLLVVVGCQQRVEMGPIESFPGQITVIDAGGPDGDTGWWPSLAFDHHDQPHLSYCDAHHGDLRYGTLSNGHWKVDSIVSQGAVGKYTAIAVDSRGQVGIAFYDQDMKYLRYASNAQSLQRGETRAARTRDAANPPNGVATAWWTERIAWGLEVGMASELRFDDQDVPHLFYYVPSGKLVHAYRPNDHRGWQTQIIAKATGSWTIRISPVERPDGFWISYVDWTFKDTTLFLARPRAQPLPSGLPADTPQFESELVATRYAPGWRSALFFERGQPWLLYSLGLKSTLHIGERRPGRMGVQIAPGGGRGIRRGATR